MHSFEKLSIVEQVNGCLENNDLAKNHILISAKGPSSLVEMCERYCTGEMWIGSRRGVGIKIEDHFSMPLKSHHKDVMAKVPVTDTLILQAMQVYQDDEKALLSFGLSHQLIDGKQLFKNCEALVLGQREAVADSPLLLIKAIGRLLIEWLIGIDIFDVQ